MTTAALPPPPASAPSRPVRAMPGAMPDVASEPPALPAPLVFEQPQLDKIKPLEALPRIEIVETPKPVDVPRPVAPKAAPVAAAPEQPKAVASKPAPEQPKVVASPVAAEAPKAAETLVENPMSAMASVDPNHIELPSLEDYPKVVFVHLPMPKPPMSPAQRLNLTGDEYDKAEKCLAQAIYFEARAEPVRGQQAVAQVVLNRVFSPYYPKDVCSVVYPERAPAPVLPVHLRLRRQARGDPRARLLGARQPHRPAGAACHGLVARGGEGHALPRHLCEAGLDPRHEAAGEARRAHLLPPAQLGRRLQGSAVGYALRGSRGGAGADDQGRAQEGHEVVSFLRAGMPPHPAGRCRRRVRRSCFASAHRHGQHRFWLLASPVRVS